MLNEMIMESQSEIDNISSMEMIEWPHQHQHDTLIQSSRSRFFCGEGRSQSPFSKTASVLLVIIIIIITFRFFLSIIN